MSLLDIHSLATASGHIDDKLRAEAVEKTRTLLRQLDAVRAEIGLPASHEALGLVCEVFQSIVSVEANRVGYEREKVRRKKLRARMKREAAEADDGSMDPMGAMGSMGPGAMGPSMLGSQMPFLRRGQRPPQSDLAAFLFDDLDDAEDDEEDHAAR